MNKNVNDYVLSIPNLGPDVSEHNGVIDWEALSTQIDFAMLRAGYGITGIDKQFVRNADECTRLGIPFGVYWFSYAGSVDTAVAEARKCVETISPYRIYYPVAFDWEDDSYKRCIKSGIVIKGKTIPSNMADAFLGIIEENGYVPCIYTNMSYLNQFFDTALLNRFHLWYAAWPGTKSVNVDRIPSYNGYSAHMWQYSSAGKYKGSSSTFDLNACYIDYPKMLNEEMNKMTAEEIYNLLMQKLNFQKQSSWAESEIAKAKELGFTDGSRPYEIASRAEVMAMINRAIPLVVDSILNVFKEMEFPAGNLVTVEQLDEYNKKIKQLVDMPFKDLRKAETFADCIIQEIDTRLATKLNDNKQHLINTD